MGLLILLDFREQIMQASNERNADQNEACFEKKKLQILKGSCSLQWLKDKTKS